MKLIKKQHARKYGACCMVIVITGQKNIYSTFLVKGLVVHGMLSGIMPMASIQRVTGLVWLTTQKESRMILASFTESFLPPGPATGITSKEAKT